MIESRVALQSTLLRPLSYRWAVRRAKLLFALTSCSSGPLAGGANYAPSARGRLAWFVRRHAT